MNNFCSAPFRGFYQGLDGKISVCCQTPVLIDNKNYEEALQDEKIKNLRKKFLKEITSTNNKIKKTINHLEKWKFIDICNPMLKAGYEKFYDQDQLHMNDLGYSLLSKSLRDEIAKIN